ncbi:MAG: hypothetical protein IJK46_07590 [Prevotella sp.]|nr:hypothetical protein [Prevotella sp.]
MENKKSAKEPLEMEGMYEPMEGRWLIPIQKEKITKMITESFHRASADWDSGDSRRIVNIVERLVFNSIDVHLLNRQSMAKDGFSFSFSVTQGMCSDELLDLLMEYHSDKWHFIQEIFMQDGQVDLLYEDRYINSPIGCLILAQFIRRLRDLFKLQFRSIEIVLSRKDFRVLFDDKTLKIDRKFSFPENRDGFFQLCMDKIVGNPYSLHVRNTKHARTLIIKNGTYELSISPDGGISHGWGIENGIHSDLTVDVLKENLDINIHCFNRPAHSFDRKGIPYVVSLSRLEKSDD